MRFIEHDHVVEAFSPDRADESLNVSVLPRRPGRGWSVANAHGAQTLYEDRPIRGVPIPNEVLRLSLSETRYSWRTGANRMMLLPDASIAQTALWCAHWAVPVQRTA
jgi:hypothetical protein